jgi:hypothetical protein
VIRLKYNPVEAGRQPVALKMDPGAKTSGMAVVRVTPKVQYGLHLSELTHRGPGIHDRMDKRAAYRRNGRPGTGPQGSETGPGLQAGCSRA